jgi:hypothetical protein
LYIGGKKKLWLGGARQTRFWVGELQVGGAPQILNLEARKFWQRFVSPNHPQNLFQNMQLGIMNTQYIITLSSKEY